MKQTLILCCVFITWAGWAQRLQVVAPNGLANVEGNSSTSEPFTSTSFRFQQVFDAAQFGIPPGASGRIEGISFRIDGASTEDVLLFFGGGTTVLSTTPREPDELSSVFAENRGADSVTIWNGALSFSGDPASGMPPAPFNPVIPAPTPFFYIPSRGNLLLDVRGRSGEAFLPGALDGHAVTGDSISWVYANSELVTSGTLDTFGLVTRFDITIIPEPAPWLLWGAGLAAVLLFKRR